MTRLQKKCLIAAAGTHLLVVVAILCSGFIRPTPKIDNTTVLDVIPANLVDQALSTGVQNPQTPPPTPTPPTPTPPTPTPPTPTPPAPTPKQETIVQKVEKLFTPEKTPGDEPTPTPPKKHEIKVDLTPVTHTTTKQNSAQKSQDDDAKRQQQLKAQAYRNPVRTLSKNFSSAATKVELHGTSSASSASYGAAILAVYYHAWAPPQNMSTDSAAISFEVTISREGSVISSHIVKSSGDADIDRAVQQMLDRVTFIAPFPDGAEDNQRTYPINFDATRTSIQ